MPMNSFYNLDGESVQLSDPLALILKTAKARERNVLGPFFAECETRGVLPGRIDAAEIARFEARAKSFRLKRLDLTSNTILSALHKLINRDPAAAAALPPHLPLPTIIIVNRNAEFEKYSPQLKADFAFLREEIYPHLSDKAWKKLKRQMQSNIALINRARPLQTVGTLAEMANVKQILPLLQACNYGCKGAYPDSRRAIDLERRFLHTIKDFARVAAMGPAVLMPITGAIKNGKKSSNRISDDRFAAVMAVPNSTEFLKGLVAHCLGVVDDFAFRPRNTRRDLARAGAHLAIALSIGLRRPLDEFVTAQFAGEEVPVTGRLSSKRKRITIELSDTRPEAIGDPRDIELNLAPPTVRRISDFWQAAHVVLKEPPIYVFAGHHDVQKTLNALTLVLLRMGEKLGVHLTPGLMQAHAARSLAEQGDTTAQASAKFGYTQHRNFEARYAVFFEAANQNLVVADRLNLRNRSGGNV